MPIEVDASKVHSIEVDPSNVTAYTEPLNLSAANNAKTIAAQPTALQNFGQGINNFAAGVTSVPASIGLGAYNLTRKLIPSLPEPPADIQHLAEYPDTPAGRLGALGGNVATFMLPGAAVGKGVAAVDAATQGSRLGNFGAKVLARGVGEGASAGSLEYVKSGGDLNKTKAAAITGGISGAAAPILTPIVKGGMRYLTDALGKSTGMGGEALRTIAEPAAAKYAAAISTMRGNTTGLEVVDDFTKAVQSVAVKRASDYKQAFNSLDSSIVLNNQPTFQTLKNELSNYGVTVYGARKFATSTITNPQDRKLIDHAITDVARWKDFSPAGMDTLKQRIYDYAESATPKTAPFFYRVGQSVKDNLNKNVPGYKELTAEYSRVSDVLTMVRKELSVGAENPGVTMRKISNALNQNNDYRKVVMEVLDQEAGTHLKSKVAGVAANSVVPRGLMGVGVGGGLAIAGTYLHSPAALGGAVLTSPRAVGEAMALISTIRRNIPQGVADMASKLPVSTVVPAITSTINAPSRKLPPPPTH